MSFTDIFQIRNSESESVNLPCESPGGSHIPVGDVCIGASWAECFCGPLPKAIKRTSPFTLEIVLGD